MPTLGETLKARRRELGMSLEQAEESTRIRARLLEALENDDYERLPDPGYVKGYVSSYAKFLELDSAEMLNEYARQSGGAPTSKISPAEPVVPTRREAEALPWRTALIAVAVIAVVALAVWGITSLVRGPDEPPPVPPVPSEESTAQPEAQPSVIPTLPAEEATETEAPAEEPGPFTLTVRISNDGRSWLRVTVDGDVLFEDILGSGEEREYEVQQVATVRIGAPSSVEVLRDGVVVDTGSDPNADVQEIEVRADEPPADQ